MATLTFDTLKLARKLEAAGFPREQAAGAAEALAESLRETPGLATRADLQDMERSLEDRIGKTVAEAKAEILKRMFGAMVAQTVLIVALLKLLP